jgi:hypothetical protein
MLGTVCRKNGFSFPRLNQTHQCLLTICHPSQKKNLPVALFVDDYFIDINKVGSTSQQCLYAYINQPRRSSIWAQIISNEPFLALLAADSQTKKGYIKMQGPFL